MAKFAIVSRISMANSTVRSKTSGSSVSKPKTKLPHTEMPCSRSMCTVSLYSDGRFCFLPVKRVVSSSMLSKPTKSALQPLAAISCTFSSRRTAASEHCPIQCLRRGIMRVKRSLRVGAVDHDVVVGEHDRACPASASSASTSSAGRKRIVVPFAVETLQNSHGYGQPRIVWSTWNGM